MLLIEGIGLLSGVGLFILLFIALFEDFWGIKLFPIKFCPLPEALLIPEGEEGVILEEDDFLVDDPLGLI